MSPSSHETEGECWVQRLGLHLHQMQQGTTAHLDSFRKDIAQQLTCSVIILSFTSSFIRSLLLVIHYPRRSQGRRHRHIKQEHADCHSCRLSFSDCSKHGVRDTTRSLHNWIATLRKMSSDKSHLVQLIAATFHVILLSLKFQVHPSYTLKNSPCSELFCQPRRTATPRQQLQV